MREASKGVPKYLGIDVGSVSTDFVIIDDEEKIIYEIYMKTKGNPMGAICQGMKELSENFLSEEIRGVGTTGSGRNLAHVMVGADIVKNEITCHGSAAARIRNDVATVIEIGGQDSKIILLRDGLVQDFAMNTVCAAGTGSFLDRQAERLGIPIEELGEYALRCSNPIRIAGRCAVFAESDLIHKQQLGCSLEDIIAGMCKALVGNYMSNVAKGKEIKAPIFFQGGVAANQGIKAAFETELGEELIVPEYHKVMGAYGAAILARNKIKKSGSCGENRKTGFKGFENCSKPVKSESFRCDKCTNNCEVIRLLSDGKVLGVFSDRCGRYSSGGDGSP